AYKLFADFLRTVYAPEGRTTLAVTSLPDGQKRYENDIYGRTTTRMTPDEIHQLGLREIDRIQAEMIVIAKKEGFADLAAFRTSHAAICPTAAHRVAEVPPAWSRLQCIHRRVGFVRRAARQRGRLLPRPGLGLRPPLLRTLPRSTSGGRHRNPFERLDARTSG